MKTYTDPTVLWRLRRDDHAARAIIVPHTKDTTLVWWIDDALEEAVDFSEWSKALERAEAVRARLLKDGWTDVT